MAKREKKKARSGGIVPRAVFAAAVSIGSVPSLAACGGAAQDQRQYSVAVPSSGGDSTGVDAGVGVPGVAVQPSVAVLPPPQGVAAYRNDYRQMGVAVQPSVAAMPPGVAVRPQIYGVAARPQKR